MNVDVSVVISSYNQSTSISNTIAALKRQSLENDYSTEIIIADDGSHAGELSKMRDILQAHNSKNFHTKLVWQEDTGYRLAASRNNGLKLATGNIIIFLDGDCIPDNSFLQEHIKAHKGCDDAICVGKRFFCNKDGCLDTELAMIETMEEDTIIMHASTRHSWKSVLGRNFSVKNKFPSIRFNERLFGWGGEDLAYAIDLHHIGISKVTYAPLASVSQYGTPGEGNPNVHKEPLSSSHTIINHLVIMNDNKENSEVFTEVARYLKYFSHPFEVIGSDLVYNTKRYKEALLAFSENTILTWENSNQLYQDALSKVISYSQHNKAVNSHPGLAGLVA